MAVDPDARILLVSYEASRNVKVYGTDGSFTGRVLWGDIIRYEPEGIALYACVPMVDTGSSRISTLVKIAFWSSTAPVSSSWVPSPAWPCEIPMVSQCSNA